MSRGSPSGGHLARLLAALLGLAACGGPALPTGLPSPPVPERPDLPPDELVVPLKVVPGSSLGALLQPLGLPAHEVREAALAHHDLATIRPDHELSVRYRDGAEALVALQYEVDADRILVVEPVADGWEAHVDEVAWVREEVALELTITGSLWEAGLAAGLSPADLAAIARIFEYEIDFNTELRAGARLGLVGERMQAEGRRARLGTLYAVRFVNGGKVHEAVRLVDDDGREAFYHPDGTSVVRAFLRSPLEFSRVTSGFNPRRFHPILKVRRPHNGTDFGAPSGTPVRAVADAVVTFAGRNGGHGNFVKLQHTGGVETSYSHLSTVSVRRGQRVSVGALIGRVGSTGLATGPHLHYQMWRNGRFVDAMSVKLPGAPPLERASMPALRAEVDRWMPKVPVPAPE